jgi:hypothetical protein
MVLGPSPTPPRMGARSEGLTEPSSHRSTLANRSRCMRASPTAGRRRSCRTCHISGSVEDPRDPCPAVLLHLSSRHLLWSLPYSIIIGLCWKVSRSQRAPRMHLVWAECPRRRWGESAQETEGTRQEPMKSRDNRRSFPIGTPTALGLVVGRSVHRSPSGRWPTTRTELDSGEAHRWARLHLRSSSYRCSGGRSMGSLLVWRSSR